MQRPLGNNVPKLILCESVCIHASGGGPAVWHRELPHLGLVHREDLSMILQNSQHCLLPTRKLLMTSVIVSFLLGSAKDVIIEIS